MLGRRVTFTPKAPYLLSRSFRIWGSIIDLVLRMASRSASGEGWVSAVRMPRPPALDTAAARSGTPTHWCHRRHEMKDDTCRNKTKEKRESTDRQPQCKHSPRLNAAPRRWYVPAFHLGPRERGDQGHRSKLSESLRVSSFCRFCCVRCCVDWMEMRVEETGRGGKVPW